MADLDYFSLSESTLKELAGQGDAEAMIALGIGYYFGSFGEQDVSSAFDFLSDAYRKGEIKAAPFLAEMIYFQQVSISGFDSDEDYCRRAYELYKEGEEIGMIAAIRGLKMRNPHIWLLCSRRERSPMMTSSHAMSSASMMKMMEKLMEMKVLSAAGWKRILLKAMDSPSLWILMRLSSIWMIILKTISMKDFSDSMNTFQGRA